MLFLEVVPYATPSVEEGLLGEFGQEELKKAGVYSNLNLSVGRRYKAGDGVPDWDLIRVAKVASYKGMVFGSLSTEVPPLDEYLDGMKFFLDAHLEQGAKGMEVIGGPPEQLTALMRAEAQRWEAVIKRVGLRLD